MVAVKEQETECCLCQRVFRPAMSVLSSRKNKHELDRCTCGCAGNDVDLRVECL